MSWAVAMLGGVVIGGPLLTYLETYVGARFPSAVRELYPSFFSIVRRSLRAVVLFASEGAAASDDDARAILAAEWPADRLADHRGRQPDGVPDLRDRYE